MNIIEKTASVGDDVELGDNNHVGHGVIITGKVKIGNGNKFFQHVIVGTPSLLVNSVQDNAVQDNAGIVEIGDNNVIREFSTINQPTKHATKIKSNCFIMLYVYVPHDAEIHDGVIIGNSCQIGGHCKIMQRANLGFSTVVHQFSTIGSYVMAGMGSVVTKDVPPFYKIMGNPARCTGINTIGMKRNGFNDADIREAAEIQLHLLENDNIENNDMDFSQMENTTIAHEFKKFFDIRNATRNLIGVMR